MPKLTRINSDVIYEGEMSMVEAVVANKADLHGANLIRANLIEANLSGADLSGADLIRANLREANLREADLREADLIEANLSGADLSGADLREADLSGADLRGADLREADLRRTILDPDRAANGKVELFAPDPDRPGHVIGYRTRCAGHIDQYRDGWIYSADWFSVCELTECHPGLYLWPTLERARACSSREIIKVSAPAEHVHQAGDEWRCRWFEVIGAVSG